MKTATLTPPPVTKELHQCPRCLFTEDVVSIGEHQCEMCDLQDQLKNQGREPWADVLKGIKKKGEGRQYDALIGLSGGQDSSVLAYLCVKVWGLRVLAVHFDNHYNTPEANNNIDVLVKNLNIDFIRYFVNKEKYDTVNEAMVWAGVPDTDINNDNTMAAIMSKACKDYGIKTLINGHDYRNEGSSPAKWSKIDPKYMANIYQKYTGKKLTDYPILTIWDQVTQGLKGIRQVRPYHYDKIDRTEIMIELVSWGWQSYGAKHAENFFTLWVGGFLLPKKFGIDKRITYLSARIREGVLTKETAREFLAQSVEVNPEILGEHKEKLMQLADSSPIRDRSIYGGYNFKRWKPVLWILAKLKIIPYTFFVKYTK